MSEGSERTLLDLATARTLASEANLAPSVHNVQPWRWRFRPDGQIELLQDLSRTLAIGDPKLHDHRVSLGAAWEGLSIACSRRGLRLEAPLFVEDREVVARARIIEGSQQDDLSPSVPLRQSWRGRFDPIPEELKRSLFEQLTVLDNLKVIHIPRDVRWIAGLAEQASREFMIQPPYAAELYQWLRFSPKDPNWSRDGLNAEAMSISRAEAALGSKFLSPPVFRWMIRLGLAAALTSEAPKNRSASFFLLHLAPEHPKPEDPLETGRRFYRQWLSVTAVGLAACPVSALADSRATAQAIAARFELPKGTRLYNVLRVGKAPAAAAAYALRKKARLPVAEILEWKEA